MSIKVLKFGGSSQSKNTYEMIYDTIKNDSNNKYIIVLSAIKGVTNSLLKFTESKNFSEWNKIIEVNKELSIETIGESISFINTIENKLWDLELDTIEIIAMGEFFTTNILNDYLISKDIKSTFISSFDVIKSNLPNNGLYNKGEFNVDAEKIITTFQDNNVIIIKRHISSLLTPNIYFRRILILCFDFILLLIDSIEVQSQVRITI